MAGLLNATKQKPSTLSDPILQQIERQIDAKVPPQLKRQYDAIVTAGMAILYNKKTEQFIQQRMQASPDMVKNVSKGVADLIMMVFQNSGQMKNVKAKNEFFQASMLACVTLMCQVLDLTEKLGVLQVTTDLVDQCTQATYNETMAHFGITPEMVKAEMSKAQKGVDMSQPAPAAPPPQAGV